MLGMFASDVLDTKVVDYKCERDGSRGVSKQAMCVLGLMVSVFS